MFLLSLLLVGCYRYATVERMPAAEIPDRVYEIYRHSLTVGVYAVVLDIPSDGKRIFMRHTDRTERLGMGRPGPYVDEFERRVKGFGSVIRILDLDGIERGYLMVSHELGYLIERYRDDIMISIVDPYSDEQFGPQLQDRMRKRRIWLR